MTGCGCKEGRHLKQDGSEGSGPNLPVTSQEFIDSVCAGLVLSNPDNLSLLKAEWRICVAEKGGSPYWQRVYSGNGIVDVLDEARIELARSFQEEKKWQPS